MTTTEKKGLPGSSSAATGTEPVTNAHGETIPPEAFESDFEVRPLPLTPEQLQQMDARIEALRKHKKG